MIPDELKTVVANMMASPNLPFSGFLSALQVIDHLNLNVADYTYGGFIHTTTGRYCFLQEQPTPIDLFPLFIGSIDELKTLEPDSRINLIDIYVTPRS